MASNPVDGFFMPVKFTDDDPVAWLADPIDPATGELLSIERGFYPTDSDVITALRTERASGSAVEDVGQQFRKAKRIDPQLPEFLRQETVLALKHLTESGDLRLDRIDPAGVGDTALLSIQYVPAGSTDPKPLLASTGLAAAGN
jgi:hypothetical protein